MITPTHTKGQRPREVRPVFVVGYMHSGTTLVANVLRRSPDVYGPSGETKFFARLNAWQRRHPDLHDPAARRDFMAALLETLGEGGREAEMEPAVRGAASHAAVFGAACDALTQAAGARRWVEKTPAHIFHVEAIRSAVPDALFVEVVRDPRDVLASKKTRRETVWTSDRYAPEERERKHLEKAYDPVLDTLAWASAVRAGRQGAAQGAADWHVLRYEDLVIAPNESVRALCTFLALPYDDALLDVAPGLPADVGEAGRARGVTSRSVGRWRTVLGGAEVACCQWLGREGMRRFNYEPVFIAYGRRLGLPLLVGRSGLDLVRRVYRRRRLHGRGYVAELLAGYGRRLARLLARS